MTKKPTNLEEALDIVREDRRASDLKNAAHAIEAINENIAALDKRIAQLHQLSAKIVELTNQNPIPTDELRRLYDQARH